MLAGIVQCTRTRALGDFRRDRVGITESPIGNVSGRAQGLCSAIAGERDAENAGSIERLVISPREMEPSGTPPFADLRPVSPTSQTPPVEVRGRKYLAVEEGQLHAAFQWDRCDRLLVSGGRVVAQRLKRRSSVRMGKKSRRAAR